MMNLQVGKENVALYQSKKQYAQTSVLEKACHSDLFFTGRYISFKSLFKACPI